MDMILLELLNLEDKVWIDTKTNVATSLAAEANSKKLELTPEQLVLKEYHEYLDIFDEDKANRYPEPRPWDHKIEDLNRNHSKCITLLKKNNLN